LSSKTGSSNFKPPLDDDRHQLLGIARHKFAPEVLFLRYRIVKNTDTTAARSESRQNHRPVRPFLPPRPDLTIIS
jgi:hypothetical protein